MTDKRLDGRVALVTGGGNGVGRACAIGLAEQGASVVVNDLGTDEYAQGVSSTAAESTVAAIRELGGEAEANFDSVATPEGCAAAVATAVDAFGKVDIVVGCAGALLEGSLAATDQQYEDFIALYMSQKFWLAREVVPGMAERGYGRLITTTSYGATGLLGSPVFAAAMAGVISMTWAIAHEYAEAGITANCLSPGAATRLHATARDTYQERYEKGIVDDQFWNNYLKTPPPEYVAPIVAWLCGDAAAGVTGHVFQASGGLLGRFNRLEVERTAYRGDHADNPPWTMDELDIVVPRLLLMRP
jgi:NAD(P)-dependent dehydrogenase (short-subunit alcohol dehydrogenase family)